jgi:hypothetical protein
MRPEVDQTVTLGHVKRMAVLYSGLFVAALGIGWALWVTDSEGLALTVWLFGNGFTAFMGVLTVTWDLFEYLEDRREPSGDGTTDRELAPEVGLSRDTRIGLRVMFVLLALTAVVAIGFAYALGYL